MDGGIRATHNLAKKERKEVWGTGRENTRDRDRGRESGVTLEMQGVLNRGGGE
jgi:hypothetical protein